MGFYQVILTLGTVYEVDFSSLPEYQQAMKAFEWVDFRLFKFFNFEFLGPFSCTGTFEQRLIWKSIVPIFLLIFMLAIGTLVGLRRDDMQFHGEVTKLARCGAAVQEGVLFAMPLVLFCCFALTPRCFRILTRQGDRKSVV